MNKKLAFLLFAIGVGAASAPAFATSCEGHCQLAFKACMDAGNSHDVCSTRELDCFDSCAFQD